MAIGYRDLETAKTTAYVRRYGFREHPVLKKCRLETLKSHKDDAIMMTAPEEAAFLAFLVELIGARKGLEIGVFTGYSSVSFALALPPDGELVVCEYDPKLLQVASGYWQEAGVDAKITAHVGPAADSLGNLLADDNQLGSFDFAYIDANKDQYDIYYESALKLVKPGGVIMLDNMLWGGRVADRKDDSANTVAIRQLNEKLHQDERVSLSMIPLSDGVSFLRKL